MIVERRLRERFPLQLGVAYRHPDSLEWTTTTSSNISSSGLLFTTPEEIWRPDPIEIFLDWHGASGPSMSRLSSLSPVTS